MEDEGLIRAVNRTAARANRSLMKAYQRLGAHAGQDRTGRRRTVRMLKRFAAVCEDEARRNLRADAAFGRAG